MSSKEAHMKHMINQPDDRAMDYGRQDQQNNTRSSVGPGASKNRTTSSSQEKQGSAIVARNGQFKIEESRNKFKRESSKNSNQQENNYFEQIQSLKTIVEEKEQMIA
jgi:hypothetical protein